MVRTQVANASFCTACTKSVCLQKVVNFVCLNVHQKTNKKRERERGKENDLVSVQEGIDGVQVSMHRGVFCQRWLHLGQPVKQSVQRFVELTRQQQTLLKFALPAATVNIMFQCLTGSFPHQVYDP